MWSAHEAKTINSARSSAFHPALSLRLGPQQALTEHRETLITRGGVFEALKRVNERRAHRPKEASKCSLPLGEREVSVDEALRVVRALFDQSGAQLLWFSERMDEERAAALNTLRTLSITDEQLRELLDGTCASAARAIDRLIQLGLVPSEDALKDRPIFPREPQIAIRDPLKLGAAAAP